MNTTAQKTNNNNATNKRDSFKRQPFGDKRKGGRFSRPGFQPPKPEFEQKIISIRRVTRVMAGGRRISFSVALAIGDKKGSIGLGTGKGTDTAIAINKAVRNAKKNMFKIKTDKEMSIPHEVSAKHTSSDVTIWPNKDKGLVAGSTVREILILSGVRNVTAKINSRSKNKLNNARATYEALLKLKDDKVAAKEEPQKEEALKAEESK